MPLSGPIPLRFSEAHIEFLEELRQRHSHATRSAVIRALIEEARIRDQRRKRRQQTAQPTR